MQVFVRRPALAGLLLCAMLSAGYSATAEAVSLTYPCITRGLAGAPCEFNDAIDPVAAAYSIAGAPGPMRSPFSPVASEQLAGAFVRDIESRLVEADPPFTGDAPVSSTPVPEPASLPLLGSGLAVAAGYARRRRRKQVN